MGGLTAIVCDDAPGFRALLTALLQEAGLDVVAEADSWEATERLSPGIDAIVVDLWMPELDVAALARVRAASPHSALAVVTALRVADAAHHVEDVDVDLLLAKTEPPLQIAAKIADCAQRRADLRPA